MLFTSTFSQEILNDMLQLTSGASTEDLKRAVSFGLAILSPESTLPDFPIDNTHLLARIIQANPAIPVHSAIYRLYPYNSFLPRDALNGMQTLLHSLNISVPPEDASVHKQRILEVERKQDHQECLGSLVIDTRQDKN